MIRGANKGAITVLRILLTFVMAVSLVPALADEISLTEFVAGTVISSSDMNQNFRTLVEESNENDGRVTALENVTGVKSLTPTWIDGLGQEIGRWNGQSNPWGIIPILNDIDLVFPPFASVSGNGIVYNSEPRLWYNDSRCENTPRAQYTTKEDWRTGAQLFVTRAGYFAYASSNKGGDSWRASAYSYWNTQGQFQCVQGLRDLDGWYEVIVTEQRAPIPIELPLTLRWR